jgi:hypothetical protein
MAQTLFLRKEAAAVPAVRSPAASKPGTAAFVWACWALLAAAATALVAGYGENIPLWDDYNIVLPLIGDRPITLGWLWEQCNEHRIPLPKLILFGADRLAHNDIRAGMFLSVLALAALGAALIALAARLRGGLHPFDAVFALLTLNPAHAANLLWSYQFHMVLPTALGSALLIPIVARPRYPGPRAALCAGGALALLPLCGGAGLAYVPALALWLLAAAWAEGRARRPGAMRCALVIALAPVPALVLTVFYFHGFQRTVNPEATSGALAGFGTALQFLCGGIGAPAEWAWPYSGAVTLGLVLLALLFLGRAWTRQHAEGPRIVGLVAFLAAVATLGAAVGWGRGWAGDRAGFQDRYVTMAAPLWCWLALALRLYAPPVAAGLLSNALFAALCVFLWPNAQSALRHGQKMAAEAQALAHDLRAGLPAYSIVRRYTPKLHPSQDEVARVLPLLRRAGFGPFALLRENPPFRARELPLQPSDLYLARWQDHTHTAQVIGVDPQITFTLPCQRYVAGIRIKYAHANRQRAPARFQLTWQHAGQTDFPASQRYTNWFQPTGDGKETTVWIDEVIEQFRIQPDNQPCTFRVDAIVLLQPR